MIVVAIFAVMVLVFVAGALSAWTLSLKRPVTWDDIPGLMQERKAKIEYPFRSFTAALRAKNADLYAELSHLSPGTFWRQWKRVYPEDFPHGGASPAHVSSVVL